MSQCKVSEIEEEIRHLLSQTPDKTEMNRERRRTLQQVIKIISETR